MKVSKLNQSRKKKLAKSTDRNWLQVTTDAVEGFFLDLFEKIGLASFDNWYLKNQEGMRYLVFGGLTTALNIAAFIPLDKLGLHTLVSNSIAWTISIFFAYFTNKYCVFNKKAKNKKDLARETSQFIGARLGSLAIDELFMLLTVNVFGWNSILMKVISNIIVIIINYILSKLIIFKKSEKSEE